MSQLLLINPRRRKARKAATKARRKSRRPMSALQKQYFGGKRNPARRAAARRRVAVATSAPARRRRAKLSGVRRVAHRGASRAGNSIRATMPGVISAVKGGVVGGAGAVVVDMAMGQAAGYLPVSLTSRYSADGSLNYGYYATKAALALGLGILGQKFLPGSAKRLAGEGAQGALVVMSYEMMRSLLPASITMGFFNPATVTATGNVTSMGKYLSQRPQRSGMGLYLKGSNSGGSATSGWTGNNSYPSAGRDTRVGEGAIR